MDPFPPPFLRTGRPAASPYTAKGMIFQGVRLEKRYPGRVEDDVRQVEEDAMSDKELEPIPEKFIAMLAREKASLEDQLKKAVRDYPVLVLAYRIQELACGGLSETTISAPSSFSR